MGRVCSNCKATAKGVKAANQRLRSFASMKTPLEKEKWKTLKASKPHWNMVKEPFVCTECIPELSEKVSQQNRDAAKNMRISRLEKRVQELTAQLKAIEGQSLLEKVFNEFNIKPIIQALILNDIKNSEKLCGARRYSPKIMEFARSVDEVSPSALRLLKNKYNFLLPSRTLLHRHRSSKVVKKQVDIVITGAPPSLKPDNKKLDTIEKGEVFIDEVDAAYVEEGEIVEVYVNGDSEHCDDQDQDYKVEEEEVLCEEMHPYPAIVIGFNSKHKVIRKEIIPHGSECIWTT